MSNLHNNLSEGKGFYFFFIECANPFFPQKRYTFEYISNMAMHPGRLSIFPSLFPYYMDSARLCLAFHKGPAGPNDFHYQMMEFNLSCTAVRDEQPDMELR